MKKLQRQLVAINFAAVSFALAISGGMSMWVLRLNAEERLFSLALVAFLLTGAFVLHAILVRPLIADMEGGPAHDPVSRLAAMRCYPVQASKRSWYLWMAMDAAGSAFYYLYLGNWATPGERHGVVSVLLCCGLLAGGGVAFLLQYYAYKILLMQPLREAASQVVARGGAGAASGAPAYGLRNKLVVSALTLLTGALLFSSIFGFTRIAEGMQARLVVRATGVMERLAPEVESGLRNFDSAGVAARLEATRLGGGGQLFVVNAEGDDLLGLNAEHLPLAQLAAMDELNWRSSYLARSAPVAGGKYTLVAVFPWNLGEGNMGQAANAFFWLFIFVTLVTMAVATFSARDIVHPVKEIVYRAERIARGDLSEPLELLSEDEVGEFSADLEQVRRFLRSILGDVDDASRQIETLSNRVLAASQSVAQASVEQSQRLGAGLRQLDTMTLGFDRISSVSLELANQASEGGSSIYQFDATVREVDGSTDLMVGRVASIRSGIDKMHRVAELIFANLGDLSSSMDVTVRNIRKFSDSIRRNEERVGTARALSTRVLESSREGIDLTAQTLNSIEAIEKSAEGIAVILEDLIGRLNDVGKLIGVIDEVADDTKLLSLNAAIIAAQAGTQGRSFSVLAEKIKTLADRTNVATGQIISMIEQVGDSSHALAHGMELVRDSVKRTRRAARDASERLDGIIACARTGFDSMELVAGASGKHVEEGQAVERAVVGLANSVEQIHASVRSQRTRAADVGSAMERVEDGVRTLKTAARAQADGGRILAGSIDQVVTMVTHLKKILLEQQTEVHRIREAIRAIEEGAVANQSVSRELNTEVEALRAESATFHRFIERFRLA